MTNPPSVTISSTLTRTLAVALAVLLNLALAQAAENVIYRFDKTHGSQPLSGLVADGAGNLYGTTNGGGVANCGTVFELSRDFAGKWTETLLYSFHGCYFQTLTPIGTMVINKEGNLFGVQQGFVPTGVIFELTKTANGTWSYSVVYDFGVNNEGSPNADLTWDGAGNLYGTTAQYYSPFEGEAFKLSPQSNGGWKETVLYAFPSPNGVGLPVGGLTFDKKGNLYGAAYYGSSGAYGAVYELSPQTNPPWTLTVLYNFTYQAGDEPNSKLTFDSNGNLYGTTMQLNSGALYALGEVFELSPTSGPSWEEQTIHIFSSGSDGNLPVGALVVDANGNVYGTTQYGGLGCNQYLCGTVYKLSPQSGGIWKETILHQFESAEDGSEPRQGLLLDSSGNLYGTTSVGGSRHGLGTVFEITP